MYKYEVFSLEQKYLSKSDWVWLSLGRVYHKPGVKSYFMNTYKIIIIIIGMLTYT